MASDLKAVEIDGACLIDCLKVQYDGVILRHVFKGAPHPERFSRHENAVRAGEF